MDFARLIGRMTTQNTPSVDIWQFQHRLTQRLSWWAWGSLLAGGLLLLPNDTFWNGVAVQFIVWGLVDLAIAIFGARSAAKRRARMSLEEQKAAEPAEHRKLSQTLWFNTALDVLYLLAGYWMLTSLGANDLFWQGGGWGVLIQGGFLFFFDLVHAWQLR